MFYLVFIYFKLSIVEEHMISQNLSESERKSNGSGGHEGETPQDFVDVLLEIQRDKKAGSLVDRDNIKAAILVNTSLVFSFSFLCFVDKKLMSNDI